MAPRKEQYTVYDAGWRRTDFDAPNPPHRLNGLKLTVSHDVRNTSQLDIWFNAPTKKDCRAVEHYVAGLVVQFLPLRIDFGNPPVGMPVTNYLGQSSLQFRCYIRWMSDFSSEKTTLKFLNKVAAILGYPQIDDLIIHRRFDVRVKVNDESRWKEEGWWLVELSGGHNAQ